jgi:hypothetical protein
MSVYFDESGDLSDSLVHVCNLSHTSHSDKQMPLTALVEDLPVSNRLERLLYFVINPSAGDGLKIIIGSNGDSQCLMQ